MFRFVLTQCRGKTQKQQQRGLSLTEMYLFFNVYSVVLQLDQMQMSWRGPFARFGAKVNIYFPPREASASQTLMYTPTQGVEELQKERLSWDLTSCQAHKYYNGLSKPEM